MQELILKLRELVEAGTKRATLEESIGLPKNSLSAVLNGTNPMPQSWIPKIQSFLDTPIAAPEPNPERKMIITKTGDLSLAPSEDEQKRANDAIEKINKDFGAGSIMRLGDNPLPDVSAISTGSLSLDAALGVGGLPQGRITEIYGPESSGKTTIAQHVIAEAQKKGGLCAFIDAEHAFDETYARAIGINTDNLYLSQPDYGEHALEEADRLIQTGAYSVVVIDSVAALVPKAELEGEMGDTKMGLQARLMSQALRKMTASVSKTQTICIFINQLRATIGNIYGPSEITTGGQALKFYASVRLDIRRSAILKDGDEAYGNRVKVKVVKNKVAPPFKTSEFDIIYGHGINKIGEILDLASEKGIVRKSGSWYAYKEDKLGQGREAVCDLLKSNPELVEKIINELTTL